MLSVSEERRRVFPKPPLVSFKRCKNLRDILVRAKLHSGGGGNCNTRGCTPCSKSRCQACSVMCDSKTFRSHSTNKEYQINFSFDCDSSDVVYLMECRVCGVQYVDSTCTPFRNRIKTIRRAVVSFMVVLRGSLRQRFSGILPEERMRDSLKMLVLSL